MRPSIIVDGDLVHVEIVAPVRLRFNEAVDHRRRRLGAEESESDIIEFASMRPSIIVDGDVNDADEPDKALWLQ